MRPYMRSLLPALMLAALCAGAAPAAAAPGDDIGSTVRIVNLVTGAYSKDLRHLAKGDSVRQDELIEVSPDGIGEIRLKDNTELALGPGARLLLDEFVYDPDISGGAIVVDLVRGAFRFITGIAAKPAYVIRTPTASITVRGTVFDVYVLEGGRSFLLLLDGAVEICNARAECGLHDEPGKLVEITADGVIGTPLTWASLGVKDLPFETAFPFVVTPPEVDPDSKLSADDIVSGDVPGVPSDTDDDDGGRGDDGGTVDEPDLDDGPGPGPGPLVCWQGWKEVPKGFDSPGWRVKKKRRGGRTIWCAHPVAPLPPGPGTGPGLPGLPPTCIGGKVVALMMLPPKWSCVCPAGKKRLKIGKKAYLCKGKPDGGTDGGKNPKKDCLDKGWKWTGKVCLPPIDKCPKGTFGKWPKCKKIVIDECPKGSTGKWPNCKKIVIDKCPKGSSGKWPNCKKIVIDKCPQGFAGKWPNCKKLGLKKPEKAVKPPKELPKVFKQFQLPKKD